jgi:hypothetical protein
MLVCGIINELETSMAKKDLLSYFFCRATDSRINNATASQLDFSSSVMRKQGGQK